MLSVFFYGIIDKHIQRQSTIPGNWTQGLSQRVGHYRRKVRKRMCFSMVIYYDKYYRGVGESSRPRKSHKLQIAGANPASASILSPVRLI